MSDPRFDRTWCLRAAPSGDERVYLLAVDISGEILEDRRMIVTRLVHELRNVSFGVSTTLDGLVDEVVSKNGRDSVEYLRILGARLSTMASGFIDFVAEASLDRTPIAATEIIDAACERCGVTVVRCGDLAAQVLPGSWLVRALALLLADADAACTAVIVCVRVEQNAVRISVRDSGPALERDGGRAVWEPFVRRRRGGNGLGLAVARRLVTSQGGSVDSRRLELGGAELSLIVDRAT